MGIRIRDYYSDEEISFKDLDLFTKAVNYIVDEARKEKGHFSNYRFQTEMNSDKYTNIIINKNYKESSTLERKLNKISNTSVATTLAA